MCKNYKITIIVPAYNEQECIEPFCDACAESLKKLNNTKYNILFIDDGSTDKTLEIVKKLADYKTNINYIALSRNFGKEAAIYAGLQQAYNKCKSDFYVLMDADLQDPPSLLPEMIDTILNNDDIDRVAARRTTRKGEPPIRSLFARLYYAIMNKFSQVKLVDGARDYQLMTAKYTKAIIECGEYNRFFKGLSQWVGFNTHWVEYENVNRANGETKWSFWSLLWYSLEGGIAYTTWPLRAISFFGLILSLISIAMLIFVFIRALTIGDPVAGWPSLVCVILLLGGIILTCFGVLGLYLEKTYLEVKKRPIYITKDDNLE